MRLEPKTLRHAALLCGLLAGVLAPAVQATAAEPEWRHGASLMGDINNNLTVAVNQLYAAFSALSTTPSDPAAREGVLSAAATVATQLNTLATEMRQIGPDSTSSAVERASRRLLKASIVGAVTVTHRRVWSIKCKKRLFNMG